MAVSIVMPALELAQETGKLLAWRKQEGERVAKGEPLLEIETDKAVVEIEAPDDGILTAITAQAGAVVPVGRTIAWLVQPGEPPPVETAPVTGRTHAPAPASRLSLDIGDSEAGPRVEPAELKISPKARRLAKERPDKAENQAAG
jgi:pyruvate/2-oxoglutarate dehydrogenase complex dihydrolipoamide acyltransferase (E2) component